MNLSGLKTTLTFKAYHEAFVFFPNLSIFGEILLIKGKENSLVNHFPPFPQSPIAVQTVEKKTTSSHLVSFLSHNLSPSLPLLLLPKFLPNKLFCSPVKDPDLLIGPSLAVGHTSTLSVMYLAWSGTARRSAYLPKPFLCLDWDLGELGMNTEQLHHQKFSAANAQQLIFCALYNLLVIYFL